ncbi:MAG: hypothetical protein SFW62_06320 [Alphaproteobacteria bacterium]|nr:hypothetical protein [Alphaproteobacteria bacterium]
MPNFELPGHELFPVANQVRAGIVSYDGANPHVRAKFRQAIPRFLGSLGAVHGAKFSEHNLDAVMEVLDHKVMNAELLQVRLGTDGPVLDAALATGAPDFGVEWDKSDKLRIYPVYHGEDLCVDKDIAALFREYTKCLLYPNGMGLGTWFMREQIRRSISDPDWVFAGRDNEHFPDNGAIRGVMDKFGAVHGTEGDSWVLQLHGLTPSMESRFGVNNVTKEDLPSDALGISKCPNNFLVRWGVDGDPQQIAVTFRRLASTFDAEPVVWAKIKSHGNAPDGIMLKEVLSSIFSVGIAEIKSPERRWGVPMSKFMDETDISRAFGGPMPVKHIHAHKEEEIIQALLEMNAEHRVFGHEKMVAGSINLRRMKNPIEIIGQPLPEPTTISTINPERDANRPYFHVVPLPEEMPHPKVIPIRPNSLSVYEDKPFTIAA